MNREQQDFLKLDPLESTTGLAGDLANEVTRLMQASDADAPYKIDDVSVDETYQRGAEYVLDVRLIIDYYEVEAGKNYINRWNVNDISFTEQRIREYLENVKTIDLENHTLKFYVRNTDCEARVYPYFDGETNYMNFDIMVTITGELTDFRSLTQKSARRF